MLGQESPHVLPFPANTNVVYFCWETFAGTDHSTPLTFLLLIGPKHVFDPTQRGLDHMVSENMDNASFLTSRSLPGQELTVVFTIA